MALPPSLADSLTGTQSSVWQTEDRLSKWPQLTVSCNVHHPVLAIYCLSSSPPSNLTTTARSAYFAKPSFSLHMYKQKQHQAGRGWHLPPGQTNQCEKSSDIDYKKVQLSQSVLLCILQIWWTHSFLFDLQLVGRSVLSQSWMSLTNSIFLSAVKW